MNPTPHRAPAAALLDWSRQVLQAAGMATEDALAVAQNLVEAECRGVHSHGLLLLPMYHERTVQGGIRSTYQPFVRSDHGGSFVLDADGGPGQPVLQLACSQLAERVRRHGVASVNVVNNNHVGMLATYARVLAEQGLASLIATTAGPSVFPHGGIEPLMGNNALCFGAPAEHEPLIFDMATAVVACGKVRYMDLLGEPVPQGWVAAAGREPSTRSASLDEGGGVLPLGHKGYGLACMVDVLAGLLGGGLPGLDVGRQREQPEQPTRCSQFVLALRTDGPGFAQQLGAYMERLRAMSGPQGAAVQAPGDPELRHARAAAQDGVPLAEPMVTRLASLGHKAGIPFESLLTLD